MGQIMLLLRLQRQVRLNAVMKMVMRGKRWWRWGQQRSGIRRSTAKTCWFALKIREYNDWKSEEQIKVKKYVLIVMMLSVMEARWWRCDAGRHHRLLLQNLWRAHDGRGRDVRVCIRSGHSARGWRVICRLSCRVWPVLYKSAVDDRAKTWTSTVSWRWLRYQIACVWVRVISGGL